LQHFATTNGNIVGHNTLQAFSHPVVTYWVLQNRTSAHALAQHCCMNLAKQVQHHASTTNVA